MRLGSLINCSGEAAQTSHKLNEGTWIKGQSAGLSLWQAQNTNDFILFLQHYDVFLQVAGVFSIFRPTAFTYR